MDWLQTRIASEIILIFSSGVSLFLVIYYTGKYIFNNPIFDARLKDFQEYLYELQGSGINADSLMPDAAMVRKQQQANAKRRKVLFLKKVLKNFFKNISLVESEKIKLLFDQAGWASQDAQMIFYAMKTFLLALSVGICLIFMKIFPFFDHLLIPSKVFVLLLVAYLGWIGFDLHIKSTINTRVKVIEKQFPEVLDLMIICVEAGLSLNRTIERVGREIAHFSPEIARELKITGIELDLILNRRTALINLTQRVPSQIIRGFSMTLIQSLQQGTPLIQALDTLSSEMRLTRMQRAENKAAKLPSLLVLPLVLFVLPNIFIVLLGPAIVQLIKVFK